MTPFVLTCALFYLLNDHTLEIRPFLVINAPKLPCLSDNRALERAGDAFRVSPGSGPAKYVPWIKHSIHLLAAHEKPKVIKIVTPVSRHGQNIHDLQWDEVTGRTLVLKVIFQRSPDSIADVHTLEMIYSTGDFYYADIPTSILGKADQALFVVCTR